MISYWWFIVIFAVSRTIFFRNLMWNSLMTLKYHQGHWQSYHLKADVWPHVKCSEDNERMKRKSPFSTTPLSSDATSPANPREYLHKPRLILPETIRSLGYIFVADSIWVALQIFEQFCPKAGDANPLVAEPETDFNTKWPFRVIQGHLF